jgi:HlyD family secretion protein
MGESASASDYLTARVDRRDVETTVSATGTLQAVTTVQVGSQASGTIAWLGADFNSKVTKGQVIARLDPTTFQAQVDSARASLQSAQAAAQAAQSDVANQEANVTAANANFEASQVATKDAQDLVTRYQQISEVVSRRDVESAQAQANQAAARSAQAKAQVSQARTGVLSAQAKVAQAQAQVAAASAQLEQATANLSHTEIVSPIDGVVVSRSVDVGQTVAASLQAPTLFTIAADLTNMQVLASIDEADVGPIREGLKARFTVDAYPGETFEGTISQLRLNAQATQNVVTYTAVVDVQNPDNKLRPGMTTNLTIPTASRENVLAVPNAALRFKPATSDSDAASAAGARTQRRQGGDEAGQNRKGGATVYVLGPQDTLVRRTVETGMTDGRVTEIVSGDLKEGDIVVVGQTTAGGDAQPKNGTASPFGTRGGGGATRRTSGR